MGQCPDRDSLRNRIAEIRRAPIENQGTYLPEMLKYVSRMKDCISKSDSDYVTLVLIVGVLNYRVGDYPHAVQFTKEGLNMMRSFANKSPTVKKDFIKYFYFLSIFYDSLKLTKQKNEAIDSCMAHEIEANDDYHFASLVLQDNVRDLFNKGDYNVCVERAALGESLIHKFYRYYDSMDHIIYFIYYKANALRAQRKFREEQEFLDQKNLEFAKTKNKDYIGIVYSLFGHMYESRNDYENAIKYYQKAFDFDKLSHNKYISAGMLSQIGVIYDVNLHQSGISLKYFNKALTYARYNSVANAAVTDSFYILGNIANVYAGKKMFDSAYHYFQIALDKIKSGIHESDLIADIDNYVNANNAEAVIKVVLDKANAFLNQYNYTKNDILLDSAISIYRAADALVDKIKEEQSDIESRLFWQTDTRRLYEQAIEVSYLQKNYRNAFYFFEKSRAVLLNEQLRKQNRISDDDILKLAHFRKKIRSLERDRDTTSQSSSHYLDLQKELIITNQALERHEQDIKQKNPLYYQSFLDTSMVTLDDVNRNLLKDHQAILELFEGDSAVYSLLITPQKIYFQKVDKEDFDSTVKEYNNYISDFSRINQSFTRYTKIAAHLYQLIFAGIELPKGRIIISPSGHYFPFESLIISSNLSPNYFLNEHALSYTYSVRFLMSEFARNRSDRDKSFLGFAPVQFESRLSLATLQGSDVSLREIGSNFNDPKMLIAGQATKNEFLNNYSNYKVIQLYTHAADSSSTGEPVIHFVDSSLYLSELIAETKPLTKLIVLSACETGNGKLYEGEGVFSFNRGFAALGIPSSITNLWAVDNVATYRLTELFYQYLSEGLPVDVALQKAKLKFMAASRTNSLPYYWAATIVAGKSDSLGKKRISPWIDVAIVLFVIIALTYFGAKKRRDKN